MTRGISPCTIDAFSLFYLCTKSQIRQMADFIKLEAREKANEIRMKVCAS